MNFLFPVLAAILQAGSFTLDKVVLSVRRVTFKTYTGVSFPLIFLITLVIFFIFRPPLSFDLFSGIFFWLILASVAFSIINNLLFYRALDNDRLGEMQMIDLLGYLPLIIFSSVIFADERKAAVFIPAFIASLAVIWSHWERHHFHIVKTTIPFLAWILVSAPLRASLSKILLTVWNPISLELIRSGAIAAILLPLFWKNIRHTPYKAVPLLILTNLLTAVAWILFFFGYKTIGIVHTLLIFSLQPLLVYFASLIFLKEPLHWKKLAAFIIILLSIITAQLMSR